jgi:hypothetical protein
MRQRRGGDEGGALLDGLVDIEQIPFDVWFREQGQGLAGDAEVIVGWVRSIQDFLIPIQLDSPGIDNLTEDDFGASDMWHVVRILSRE